MSASRWIRLNIDFHLSGWLVTLSAEARLAWVMLLCYVKANGFAGVAKAIDPLTASRLWFLGEESVRQMLIAAEKSLALAVTDGEWTVVKWQEFQGDETRNQRQQRWRDRQKQIQNSNGDNALVTDVTLTETETETVTTNVVTRPQKRRNGFKPPTVDEVAKYMASRGWANPEKRAAQFVAHYETSGWVRGKGTKITSWRACVVTWEQRDGFDFKAAVASRASGMEVLD